MWVCQAKDAIISQPMNRNFCQSPPMTCQWPPALGHRNVTPSYSKQRVKVVGEPFYLSDNLRVQEKERGKRGGKLEKN